MVATSLVMSVAGCSFLDDDDEATPTPTTIVAPKLVETAQLEAILPQPGDFGPEFVIGEPDTMRVAEADLERRDVVANNLAMMAAALQMEAPVDPSTAADPAAGSQPAAP